MTQTLSVEKDFITISELTYRLNQTLEERFPRVKFEGEISELKAASSGHIYFKLKDAESQVDAVMWRGTASALRFKPEAGMMVLCDGKPNVYRGSGRLQMVVSSMSQSGEGLLQKKFLELKAKLEKEGLFAPERKRKLPFFPNAIGVVTSKTGAVIHDIMVRIQDRMPSLKVYLVDVRVQGEGASREIADAIRLLNEFNEVDVIIVGRGGGSLEDLWAFNEEEVVRAIFASRIPIISSVGHEVDISLSDLAADVRAPTPTAAAEMVVPKRSDLLARIEELNERFLAYERWFNPLEQKVDDLNERLVQRMDRLLDQLRLSISRAQNQLQLLEPSHIINVNLHKINNLQERLQSNSQRLVDTRRSMLEVLASSLENLSPFRVLSRGYSLVQKGDEIITSSTLVKVGDSMQITFAHGHAGVMVKNID